jgi:secondary thiamine-phosphate synthase enzyme
MRKRYHHNERWHDGNGYAHVRASMLKPSLNIPFKDAQLLLGTWQQVILIDFDNKKRKRNLIVQIMGEAQ